MSDYAPTTQCRHGETFEDGTTRFCSDCGETVAYFWLPADDWVDGYVDSDFRWTDEGWEPR